MDDEFYYEITNVKSSPSSSSSQCNININFEFAVKTSEFVLNPNSDSTSPILPTRQTNETVHDSAVVALNIDHHEGGKIKKVKEYMKTLARDTYFAIESMLTCLPVSIDDDNRKLVNIAIMKEFFRRRIYRDKVPVDLDLDLFVKIHEHHIDLNEDEDDEDEDDCSWTIPAIESSVESLLKKYEGKEVIYGGMTCCICLEELVCGENLLSMPCEHLFHGGCIKKWLSISHYCPACRFEMPAAAEEDNVGVGGDQS